MGTKHTMVLQAETVRTVKELQDAIGALQGPGKGDRSLDWSYAVQLVAVPGSPDLHVRVRRLMGRV